MAEVDLLRVHAWRFEWLRHGFSTRVGGESRIYGGRSLNLGWTREDDAANVASNRRLFLNSVAVDAVGPNVRLVTIRQVHSGNVQVVRSTDGAIAGALESAEGKSILEGDGLVTNVSGVMIAVGTADCAPVLVVDEANRAVGAFHAGWRGTAAKIAEEGIATMRREYGSRPEDVWAAIGPGIGACCYVVGDEVRSNFAAQFPYADELFCAAATLPDGRKQYFVDLWEANRRQLLDTGVDPSRISVAAECTACTRDSAGNRRYFSHRAEHGVTGRMLSAIGIVE